LLCNRMIMWKNTIMRFMPNIRAGQSARACRVSKILTWIHPSYVSQALCVGTIGFAQDHLHWMAWFICVCLPNVRKEKAVVSASHGSSSQFRSQIYYST